MEKEVEVAARETMSLVTGERSRAFNWVVLYWKQYSAFTEMMSTCSLLLERASSSFLRSGGARLTRWALRLVEATWKNPGEKEGTWKNPGVNMQSGKVH